MKISNWMSWEDGNIYEGNQENGNMNGKDKDHTKESILIRTENWIDDEYQVSETGYLTGDCENGNVTYLWENGQKYEGMWKDGEMDGIGVLYLEDGTIFHQGQWKNHVKVD